MKPAERMNHLQTFFFVNLNERLNALRSAGREIIRLDIGSPDLPPPENITSTLVEAARRPGSHGYQAHIGPQALRQAWAGWYWDRYGVLLDPDLEVLPLLGSKEGIFHLSLAYLDAGDYSLTTDPGYGTYTHGAAFSGAHIHRLPIQPENNFLPGLSQVEPQIWRKTKLLWLNYPNNPTGASASQNFFAQAIALAHEYDFIVCHDAAYSQVYFEGEPPPSLLQVEGAREVGVEFNTLSKSHHMAGWRSGVLVGNPQVVRTLFRLKTNADSSHFLPVFEASVAALRGDLSWINERNAILRRRRDIALEGLKAAGLQPYVPRASLYIWSSIPAGWKCESFAAAVLENAGVSLTPGTVFGPGGEGYVRIALTVPEEGLKTAMERVADWLHRAVRDREGTDYS